MRKQDVAGIGARLLRPYRIRPECPYLSEDQRGLSMLDLKGRSEWMAEWLMLAASAKVMPVGPGKPSAGGGATPKE